MQAMLVLRSCAIAVAVAVALATPAVAESNGSDDYWSSIKRDVFGERAIAAASGAFQLYAPAQAADAALVPVAIHFPANFAKTVKSLTLVIDRNPAPVAATFAFGEAYRNSPVVGERVLSTRVRVDSFSKLRAVLETTDGKLLMAEKFVAGAGGCSATPSKDPDAALADSAPTTSTSSRRRRSRRSARRRTA